MKALKNLENWLVKLKKEYDILPDNQKENIQRLDSLSSVNSVDSIWIKNNRLNVDIQFHFFNVGEFDKDFKVNSDSFDSLDLDKLENIIKEKWDYPLPESEKSRYYNKEKYSDVVEDVLFNGLRIFERYVKRLIHGGADKAPHIGLRSLIAHDLFCWMVIGKIQDMDVDDLIKSLTSNIDKNFSKRNDNKTHDSEMFVKGFGTYFYPPIWVGDYPKPSFKDEVIEKPLINYSNENILLKYKKRDLIIAKDGFICVVGDDKQVALELLNEIMATAIFRGIKALKINELELAEVKINTKDFSIRSWYAITNKSIRTKLFEDVWKPISLELQSGRQKLTEKDLSDLCTAAEKLNEDKQFSDFLSFYLESVSMLENYSFSQSFFMSWLIIERYLFLLWGDVVLKNLTSKRKKKLKNTATWSVSYIIETLSLLNIINDSNYKKIMGLKKKRDKFIHVGEDCSKEDAEECLELAYYCFKKGIKPNMYPEIILELLKISLNKNNVNFGKVINDFGQVKASYKRDTGGEFAFNEHLKALIYSMLSNRRKWADIVDKLPQIDTIFFNFDPDKLEKCDTEQLINEIKKAKCGNVSIYKQIDALPHNIRQMKKIEKDFGSLDTFVTHNSLEKIVKLLSDGKSEYKIKQMGDALALEYLKSVGIRGMKPDVHILRICGPERLDIITAKDTQTQLEEFKKFVESVNVSETYLDNLIWIFGANGYGEICTANPNCDRCELTNYCNFTN